MPKVDDRIENILNHVPWFEDTSDPMNGTFNLFDISTSNYIRKARS